MRWISWEDGRSQYVGHLLSCLFIGVVLAFVIRAFWGTYYWEIPLGFLLLLLLAGEVHRRRIP